jgi:hypothetical protein
MLVSSDGIGQEALLPECGGLICSGQFDNERFDQLLGIANSVEASLPF